MPQTLLLQVPNAFSSHPSRQLFRSARSLNCTRHPARSSVVCDSSSSSSAVGASEVWTHFAAAASGEWSGVTATFNSEGIAQDLPYQYVPAAFREWNSVPKDWHTQNSTLASDDGLLSKLKRLMPIVGCEADAVAFKEEERRSLRSDDARQGEDKTVLRDGSYSSGPRTLNGDLTARIEHCLAQGEGERWRGVFHVERDDAKADWKLKEFELHCERRSGDYDGGASLEACGYNQGDVSGRPITTLQQLEGPWVSSSRECFMMDGADGFAKVPFPVGDPLVLTEEDAQVMLPGGCWYSVGSAPGGRFRAEFGILTDEVCHFAARAFRNDRMVLQSFIAGQRVEPDDSIEEPNIL